MESATERTVVMMTILPSLVAPQVVIMTTCGATRDDKVGIRITLCCQWNIPCLLAVMCHKMRAISWLVHPSFHMKGNNLPITKTCDHNNEDLGITTQKTCWKVTELGHNKIMVPASGWLWPSSGTLYDLCKDGTQQIYMLLITIYFQISQKKFMFLCNHENQQKLCFCNMINKVYSTQQLQLGVRWQHKW